MKTKVLALIPAYNEGKHIKKVIEETLQYLPVLVVDDGSKDDTPQIVQETDAILLTISPNRGKGNALKTGFRWALKNGFYDGILTIDADGQHDPHEISKFLNCIEDEKPDLIIGKRDFSKMPFSRKAANRIGRVLFSWAMRQPIEDNQSGYRYLSRALLEKVILTKKSGFEFEVENILTCLQNDMKLSWVPIRTIYGDEKSHIHPFKHIFGFIALILRVREATS
ncbi:MAG: glycosyltransferase family 2 protein [Anaerolineaceae bacterium]|nr:glycosyltransferase family 2 protein [Anaerolineaceae bacterium]